MSKRFRRSLVVGKFSPLHKGHELLIHSALDVSAEVIILSYSKPEFQDCDHTRREAWLRALFPATRVVVATDELIRELGDSEAEFSEVPGNDDDETVHRRFCGFVCQRLLGTTVDSVFTSEDYGPGFAAELTRYFRELDPGAPAVEHVLVDRQRLAIPISATLLRTEVHANRRWLSPEVYASFVRRVCFLGGESSGKSTLAKSLAEELKTECVEEFGRELWERKNGELEFSDMLVIARTQIQMEQEALRRANRYLFCDTSPLTTLFYSDHLFGQTDSELSVLATRSYDTTILCAPDFAFIQDGTRQPQSFRTLQHEWYLRELHSRQIPFLVATGTLANRIETIKQELSRFAN